MSDLFQCQDRRNAQFVVENEVEVVFVFIGTFESILQVGVVI